VGEVVPVGVRVGAGEVTVDDGVGLGCVGVGDGLVGVGDGLVGVGDGLVGAGDGLVGVWVGVGVGAAWCGRTMRPTVVPWAGVSVNSDDNGRPVTSSNPVTTAMASTKTSAATAAIRPQW
jgi:hypothetical protein